MNKLIFVIIIIPILIFGINNYNYIDSRNVAMGNCGVTLNESSQSLVFNPAAMHCDNIVVYSGEKSLLYGIDDFGEVVSSLKLKSSNIFYGISYYQLTYSSEIKDSMLEIGMDYPLFDFFHLGIGVKGIVTKASKVDSALNGRIVNGKGYSFDLGSFLDFGFLKVGLVWKNPLSTIYWTTSIPTRIDKFTEALPKDLRVGISVKPMPGQTISFDLFGTDRGYFSGLNFGYEYYLLNFLAVRFGYSNFNLQDAKDYIMGSTEQNAMYAKGYLTFGVGVETDNIDLDYSYTTVPILGNTNRITFSIKF
jgi:hypothetical protein